MYTFYTNKPGIPYELYHKIWLIMRLTTVILIASLLQVSAATFGQRITLNKQNVPLKNVLKEIRAQSGYNFFYDGDILNNNIKTSVNLQGATIEQAVQKALDGLSLTYEIENKIVLIKKKAPSFLERLADRWNAVDFRGVVLDEKGQPLSGANVKVKGTKLSATTDSKGEFFLKGVNENSTLLISYIGYQIKEVPANSNLTEIRLELSLSKLDEVQVIAYGTTTQRYNVGSVTKVTAEEIAQQPVGNILQTLAGRVPGLVVSQNSGLSGGSVNIQIRGQNSLSKQSIGLTGSHPYDQPLFIIDGVPFATQNNSINQLRSIVSGVPEGNSGNVPGGVSPFSMLNPADIESIEVLRDADATAIYGSRAANGVILISTKKAKAGKLSLNGDFSTGLSHITRPVQFMNTAQYLEMRKEAIRNDNLTQQLSNPSSAFLFADVLVMDSTKYTNWGDYFLGGTANTTDLNLRLSGGTENTRFSVGGGMNKSGYILPGDFSYGKGSVNSNFRHTSSDQKVSVDFSASYLFSKNNASASAEGLKAFALSPNYPDLLDAEGNILWKYKNIDLTSNSLSYLKQPYKQGMQNLQSHFLASYELIKGLKAKISAGYSQVNTDEHTASPKSSQNPIQSPVARASFANSAFKSWILEPQMEYKRDFSNGILTALAGATFQKDNFNAFNISADNYGNDKLLNSIAAAGSKTILDSRSIYLYNAVFARINYIHQNRYMLNLNGRRDGSSRFGADNRFGNFGSVGAGWIFSETGLFKTSFPVVSFGKLRASYGITGSDQIGDYQYLDNWGPTGQTYQGQSTAMPLNLSDPNFSWGVTNKLELGFELGMMKDRFLVNLTTYRNRSSNQLTMYTLPYQTGFTGIVKNFPATVENKGLEFQLTSVNVRRKNFQWITTGNLSILRNKLLAFPDLEFSTYIDTYTIGEPLRRLKKVRLAGVNSTTGVFEFFKSDGTKTNTPDLVKDAGVIGNLDPKFFGGVSNAISYKGIQLDIFVQFVKQMGVNYLQQVYRNGVGRMTNMPIEMLDRWKAPGDQSKNQKYTMSGSTQASKAANTFLYSDAGFSDASYIRLKTVSLSYAFNQSWVKKMGLQSLRVFANGQNLFTISDYLGDPETQNIFGVPPMRTFVYGLNLNI